MLERRTLRLSMSQEILPLISLVGAEFVKAQLEAMKCMSLFCFAAHIDGRSNFTQYMHFFGVVLSNTVIQTFRT